MNASTSRKRFSFLIVALTVLSLVAPAADTQAETSGPITPPTISVSVEGVTEPWQYSPALEDYAAVPGQGYSLREDRSFEILNGQADLEIRDLAFDPDPFVLNNFLITNNTAVTQVYSVFVGLPTSFPAPNTIFGSVLTGVIDGGGAAGATIATIAGQPIYAAQIDLATVATLQSDPFSVVAPPAGVNSAAASFGPNPNLVPVLANMGIQLRFSLTGGDTASILSRFDVVPEPASLALGAVALLVAAAIRRARHC